MKLPKSLVTATAILLASPVVVAQERPIVVLDVTPRVSNLRSQAETMWFALDDPPPAASDVGRLLMANGPGFREQWLMKTLKERFQGVISAECVGKVTIRHDGATRTAAGERGLELRGSKDALDRARDFLVRFAAKSRKTVEIDVRVLGLGTATEGPRAAAVVATHRDFDRRSKDLAKAGAGRPVYSPRIRVFGGQTAKATVANQVAYIKDYKVEQVRGSQIADPEIGIVQDGFELELTPIFDPDGGALVLSGRINLSKLTQPIREQRMQLGGTDVTLQLPEVTSHTWNGEVQLETGEMAFVISGLKGSLLDTGRFENVEVWCLISIGEDPSKQPTGEIVGRDDKHGNIFVKWPREYVPDDPWNKAPKEVTIYRGQEKVGRASLNGGWVMGAPADSKYSVIAIYAISEGTTQDGDTVR